MKKKNLPRRENRARLESIRSLKNCERKKKHAERSNLQMGNTKEEEQNYSQKQQTDACKKRRRRAPRGTHRGKSFCRQCHHPCLPASCEPATLPPALPRLARVHRVHYKVRAHHTERTHHTTPTYPPSSPPVQRAGDRRPFKARWASNRALATSLAGFSAGGSIPSRMLLAGRWQLVLALALACSRVGVPQQSAAWSVPTAIG